MATRVIIAEDSYLVREGLRSLLEALDDIEVLAVCEDAGELLQAISQDAPDVVITDIRMPPSQTDEGIRAAVRIREEYPATGVIVLSQYAEPEYAVKLFADGSSGRAYLLKERIGDLDVLVATMAEVAQGGSRIDPEVVDVLVAARIKQENSILQRLTPRELEVLAEMAKGLNNAGIAEALFISQRAVEKHINALFSKLDLSAEEATHRRVRAVLFYLAEHDG